LYELYFPSDCSEFSVAQGEHPPLWKKGLGKDGYYKSTQVDGGLLFSFVFLFA